MNLPLARDYSRFARELLNAHPELDQELRAAGEGGWTREAMLRFLASGPPASVEAPSVEGVGRRLRQLRARVMLRTMQRDLAGLAAVGEVCSTITTLAEIAVSAGLAAIEAELAPPQLGVTLPQAGVTLPQAGVAAAAGGRPPGRLIVVGMGKLGGSELNVSSDIDLVFLYTEEGDATFTTADGRERSYHEHFNALGRRLVALLGQVTADGMLFRVDMRLRPWGDAGPLAMSIDALEQYLLVHGREWERYAWIKGRPLSGDAEALAQLGAVVRPFVFRKYLDYGAIAAMRELHAQIRAEVGRREYADHVKLGPGGIREIEFIAQAYQLIRGGREVPLQIKPTLKVLALLAERGLIERQDAQRLAGAYDFLRRVEHRIQYFDDAQKHELPEEAEDRGKLALSMGASDWTAFMATLDAHRDFVSRQFERMFADKEAGRSEESGDNKLAKVWGPAADTEEAAQVLTSLGFHDGPELVQRLEAIRRGSRYQALPESSRLRFDALVPLFIEAAAFGGVDGEARDAALVRLLGLLETVSRRAAYLALLHEHPAAIERLAKLFAASGWVAEYLSLHPILLDELLDTRLLMAEPDWAETGRQLRASLAAASGDPERQMDILRETHHAHLFRLLARDLEGALTVERLADHLSALADMVLEATLEVCWSLLSRRHGMTELRAGQAPRFAVIGYGKLGGKELGYASDLDLIFLYDPGDDDDHAAEVYARLAQRINVWLSSRTPAGVLFETDLRLRPNGSSGLLVSSLAAFRRYQRESAWTWEHQALTRARFCAGDPQVGAAFEAERKAILCLPRDAAKLAGEVRAMRVTMREGHPNRSELFDVKHDPGGMVDIEFIVQYLVLAHAHRHEELTLNHGNIALLGYAARLGLIGAEAATEVQEAYRTFRRMQHALRLKGERYARVPPSEVQGPASATLALWKAVLGED